MLRKLDPQKPYFYGVGLGLILTGAAIVAVGAVEWLLNYCADYRFAAPLFKLIGGLIVLGLGYIQLELELLRVYLPKK